MISPDTFFGKYDGKGIDFDNYYGFQCMDLYRQFVKEVLEFPQSPPVAGAKDVWTTYLQDKFDKIDNGPNNCPIKGDIVIWSTGVGQYGHIAICKDGTPTEFTSFDENWPVGSLCHFQKHNYTNVLGWLRIKPPVESPPDLSGEVEALKREVSDLKISAIGLNNKITDLETQLATCKSNAIPSTPSGPTVPCFTPTSTLAKWFYSMAKALG